ncbi:uncharacterized protein LOC114329267 isoform X1 [Diabrotica virgifera virgifera]|uniref:Partial AB-hydrolase lipase domain-containing protein n=1 Tax=Diabrotica virgifera virgifera TaxID=50390 RepID=A0ABM5KWV4_DIAVI|nr:uncharacterized protein LOC114329267 isoform X1 [Diabrotica virgifera virgifera]
MHLFKAIFLSLFSSVFSQRFDLAYYLPENWKDNFKDLKGLSQDTFNIHTLLKDLNYPIENHWITTEDGYVLQHHRISGRNQSHSTSKSQKPAVLLMHGLGGSSIDWVLWGPEKGLGLVLADAGYDVWLGNNRGNLWSRSHKRLNPDIDEDGEEFWDYSFEKCGYYDLPATIDYILQTTGEQKLFYVGFSQGTSQFFAMAALRPEYNDKIALMSAMAPIAYMGHLSAPLLRFAATYVEALTKVTEYLHIYESSDNGLISELLRTFCTWEADQKVNLCVISMFMNSGFDSHELDTNVVPLYMYTSGAGMSYNMIKHYGQEIKSGHFRRYDYGSSKNLKLYGSKVPPDFNISLITAPVDLYYGENDFLADLKYQFLRKYKYPVETHWVETEDGYVLRMQRLVGGKDGVYSDNSNKPAVLLMHGLLSSAMDFVNVGPNRSIALMLADAGYDVWLGNNRGTTWSTMHKTLDPDNDPEYYDYSFDTCGYYDLPAKIDYIIKQTGQKKIFYIGHSQGTSQFFAMAALRPEYNEKIALMTALAPVAYMTHMASPLLRLLAQYQEIFEFLLVDVLKFHNLLPYSWIYRVFAEISEREFEKMKPEDKDKFGIPLFLLCGFNYRQFDANLLPIIVSNAPAGISTKMLLHYGQEIRSGKFRRYDYGVLNIKKYKSISPPEYNVSAITAPIAIYYSQNDFFAAVKDVELLASHLPNIAKLRMIEDKRFNHVDYIWAKDVGTIINEDVIATQNKYIPSEPPHDNSANTSFGKSAWYPIITMLLTALLYQ